MSITPRPIVEPLCRFDELPERRSRGFDPLGEGRDTLFLVRLEDRVFAWRNACPHYEFARMAWKKDEFLNADHSLILCGAHGALFDIVDGHCVKGPCEGQRLTAVPLELRDGAIYILGDYAPGLRKHQPPS